MKTRVLHFCLTILALTLLPLRADAVTKQSSIKDFKKWVGNAMNIHLNKNPLVKGKVKELALEATEQKFSSVNGRIHDLHTKGAELSEEIKGLRQELESGQKTQEQVAAEINGKVDRFIESFQKALESTATKEELNGISNFVAAEVSKQVQSQIANLKSDLVSTDQKEIEQRVNARISEITEAAIRDYKSRHPRISEGKLHRLYTVGKLVTIGLSGLALAFALDHTLVTTLHWAPAFLTGDTAHQTMRAFYDLVAMATGGYVTGWVHFGRNKGN